MERRQSRGGESLSVVTSAVLCCCIPSQDRGVAEEEGKHESSQYGNGKQLIVVCKCVRRQTQV